MINRPLPYDLDAERAVLGGIMLSNPALDDVLPILSAEDFYGWDNRQIWNLAVEMADQGKPVDPVTIGQRLTAEGKLEDVGGIEYLFRVMESVPHAAHSVHYAGIVVGASRRRTLIDTATKAIEAAYTDADTKEIVAAAESRLHAILEADSGGESVHVETLLEEIFSNLDRKVPPGISTGWSDLDKLYTLRDGNLIYIAARPSMGKSGFAGNLAINVARNGHPCLFFTLEQSKHEMSIRLLSSLSGIDNMKIDGREPISESERMLALSASSELGSLPIWIDDDPGVTVAQIAAKSRLWKRKHGLKVLIIDYLQLIEPEDRKINREQQVSVISRSLKKIAGQLAIPVVCLAQLNRQVETRTEKRPRISDLRESGSLEQDANCVILLHRPEYYKPDDRPGEADLFIDKNRNGPTGQVRMQYDDSTITFRDLAAGHYQERQGGNYGF